jgi:hypothetical protein
MARKITFTTTHFQRPKKISQEEYFQLKNILLVNSDYKFDKNTGTIKEKFKSEFKFLKYSFIYLILFALVLTIFYNGGHDDKDDIFRIIITIPAIIGGIGSFFIIFYLFLEAPSYATYLRDKRNYFESMKESIIKSQNYFDFCDSFYFSWER